MSNSDAMQRTYAAELEGLAEKLRDVGDDRRRGKQEERMNEAISTMQRIFKGMLPGVCSCESFSTLSFLDTPSRPFSAFPFLIYRSLLELLEFFNDPFYALYKTFICRCARAPSGSVPAHPAQVLTSRLRRCGQAHGRCGKLWRSAFCCLLFLCYIIVIASLNFLYLHINLLILSLIIYVCTNVGRLWSPKRWHKTASAT